ncbi:TPA: LOW QUALITY PROTEIN: hypothetical protein N0F65_005288, partial [Lagenidium giganteum]
GLARFPPNLGAARQPHRRTSHRSPDPAHDTRTMDERVDPEDAPQPEIALQIKNTKHLKQVGVAVRRPRLRRSCVKGSENEDTKQWELVLYSFSDSSELTNLETLLVQIKPGKCYLPGELAQEPSVGDSKKVHALLDMLEVGNVYIKKHAFKGANVESNVSRLLGVASMAAYKNELEMPLAMGSLACLVESLGLMSDADTFGHYTLTTGDLESTMQLDSSAIWSLNLLPDPSAKSARFAGSVLEILNRGKTAMGRRLLERWIRQPLLDVAPITERQDIVQIFVDDPTLRIDLLDECMKSLPDLEKLSVNLEKKKRTKIEDLVMVYDAAKDALPRLLRQLNGYDGPSADLLKKKFIDELEKVVGDLSGYVDLIEEVVDLDSRPNLVVNAKHDEELQVLRKEWDNLLVEIEEEHQNARETIGGDIKCEKDKVRGFVFLLVNGVHFTTSKLKSLATDYKRVRAEYEKRQAHLLTAAIDVASTYVPVLEGATTILAELDVLLGFAHAASHAGSGYCRPTLEQDGESVVLTNSRHPCVELQDQVDFIPNDYELLRDKSRFQLVTGPNMGGKSTYIRQLGTIAVMAQIGSFVPAEVARLPVFDKLLVRVGAGDLQQRGVSTFMMEMLEASAILHKATCRSLVIIDELGRGTSTYDGFGLAWAISEYLLTKVRAMCLFATHFHELTALEQEYPEGFANKHVTAVTSDREITMIYQVRDGPCLESFGVHVAALAGFPSAVLERAKRKSDELESFEQGIITRTSSSTQPSSSSASSAPSESASESTSAKRRRTATWLQQFAALPLDHLAADEAVAAIRKLADAVSVPREFDWKRPQPAHALLAVADAAVKDTAPTDGAMKEPTTKSMKRHRFQKVEERVANLQTELQLHVKSNATDVTLTFHEELMLQAELTTLESFQLLFRELNPLVQTTAQLLHHQPKIVAALTRELTQERDADVQRERIVPLLKLLTALARELRKEFYPHFAAVLPPVVAIIDTKDPELSTQVFKTLTMLFTYLRAQILRDMDAVHKCYFPLLGHPKPFVRDFAAQTLSVLLRRIDSNKELKKYLMAYLKALARGSGHNNDNLLDGSSKLFLALVRNVNHGFHSRMKDVFAVLLTTFRPKEGVPEIERRVVHEILRRTNEHMIKHTDSAHSPEMLECFAQVVPKALAFRDADADCLYVSELLGMVEDLVKFKFGKLIRGDDQVATLHAIIAAIFASEDILTVKSNEALRKTIVRLCDLVWRLFPSANDVLGAQMQRLFAAISVEDEDLKAFWRNELLQFVHGVLTHTHVREPYVCTHIFPNAVKFAVDQLRSGNIEEFSVIIGWLGQYVADHRHTADDNSSVRVSHGHCFVELPGDSMGSLLIDTARSVANACHGKCADKTAAIATAWKYFKALAVVYCDHSKMMAFVEPEIKRMEKAIEQTKKDKDLSTQYGAVRAELWRLFQIASNQAQLSGKKATKAQKQQGKQSLLEALKGRETSFAMLSAFNEFMQMKTKEQRWQLLPSSIVTTTVDALKDNLRSPSHSIRLVTLQILSHHEQLNFIEVADPSFEGRCELVDLCVDLERTVENVSVDTEREIIRLLTRVKVLCESSQTPVVLKTVALNHLLGLYHVKFSTIWPHIAEGVAVIMKLHFAEMWHPLSIEITNATVRQEESAAAEDEQAEAKDQSAFNVTEEFVAVCRLEQGKINATEVTDVQTHHGLLWSGMHKFSEQVESKTKFVVPLFFSFLRDQYTTIYVDELSAPRLRELQQLIDKVSPSDVPNAFAKREFPSLATKLVRSRFLDWLKFFATFKNMKGAYANSFLHEFFFDLLMKSDEAVSKVALQCMYCFGRKQLSAYKDQLNRIVDSASFREELTNFDIREEAGIVLKEHRSTLVPVLMRLLYSKCVSKKGRNTGDTVGARRAAILSYLAGLAPSELASFVELVVRAFDVKLEEAVENTDLVRNTPADVAIDRVQQSRILGFLNLLEDMIAQIGVKLAVFVPTIADLLTSIMSFNETVADSAGDENEPVDVAMQDAEDADAPPKQEYTTAMRKQIRMLTLRRLAELVHKYDHIIVLGPWVRRVLETSNSAIMHLQNAMIGAGKASALLDFMAAVASVDRARVELTEEHVVAVIKSLSAGLRTQSDELASSARSIHPEVLQVMLQFMTSLLDGDEDEESDAMNKQLIPHIPLILSEFVVRFEQRAARYAQERFAGSAKRELVFLCRLSVHLDAADSNSTQSAHDLFQLLLPFLQRNHHSSVTDKENILDVLANLVRLLSDPRKHILPLSKLLAPGPNCIDIRSAREKLVNVFVALSNHPALTSLKPVAELLLATNAYDEKKIEEIDFERRMDALNQANQNKFAKFVDESQHLAPVISQYLQCMCDTEYSIRSAALSGMNIFMELAAADAPRASDATDKSVVLNALESIVMPTIRFSMKSPSEDVRRGFVNLLGSLADQKPLHALPFTHGDLGLLRNSEDMEADFFYNITHIQAHRKRRALIRVNTLMKEMAKKQQASANATEEDAASGPCQWLSNSTVNNILLPLIMHFIFEAQTKSQESIQQEAAGCVGSAAGLLGWSHYLALLRRMLKSIDGHAEAENTIILAICAVIDNFHFASSGCAAGWGAVEDEDESMDAHSKPQENMENQVLPMLKKYLFKGVTAKGKAKAANAEFDDEVVSSNAVVVRVPLALAIVKVLRRLKAKTFYSEFPKLLLSFTKLLKSKQEDVRLSARTTLVKITVELGPSYFLPIVEELKHTLRDGYMVFVLAYTLNAILEKVATMVTPKTPPSLSDGTDGVNEADYASPLDACIPSIMHILVEDLWRGTIENQDGSEHKSKMKEAKSCRSLDSIEMLARSITFLPNPSVHMIVSALVNKYQENETPKSLLTLQEALKRVALGLSKNPGAERSYVFLYVYNMMQACLETVRPLSDEEKEKYKKAGKVRGGWVGSWLVNEKSAAAAAQLAKRVSPKDTARVELQGRMTGFNRHQLQDKEQSISHLEELLSFALFLIYAFIRSGEMRPELVDPLVPHLMRCAAEVKHNRVVINALKCLSVLLNHQELPSMDIALDQLVNRLFKILQKAGAATRNEMVQTCYRALTVMLRQRADYKLSESQLRVLLSFVRADLEEMDHQNATYSLLKSIISSRLVIPEVYDVMLRIGELLVQSDGQAARANCASIYITFLLEYPLGPKRLTHHLKFLVQNLAYTYESGRKAVLDCLGSLVRKFPLDVINDRAQFFLLPLILRLANDESSACRELAAEVVKSLVKRMGNQQLNESVLLIGKWWNPKGTDAKLLCTAAQATGLVLASRPEFLDKIAFDVMRNAKAVLLQRLVAMEDMEDSEDMDWQVVYHTLACLVQFSDCLAGRTESWLWSKSEGGHDFIDKVIVKLLEYPHAWVRLSALRWVNSYLRRRNGKNFEFTQALKKASKEVQASRYLKTPGKLFMLASTICKLLQRPQFNVELSEQVLIALPYLCSALQACPHIPQDMVAAAEAKPVGAVEDESDNDEDDDEAQTKKTQESNTKTPLSWILTRVSYVCREADPLVQTTIFKFFAAFIATGEVETLTQFMMQMINPLFRVATDVKDQTNPSETSLLAQEVLQQLEAKVGTSSFLDAYTFVQKKLVTFRAKRKEKRKRELVADPEMAAKRKIQKNMTKQRAKQLKKRKYTLMKGTASAATKPRKAMRPGADV